MRVLSISDENKAEVARVLEFASKKENHYKPFAVKDAALSVPGDDLRYVAQLDSFRCVFTITEDSDGKTWKHLSISIPSEKYPHPLAAFTIATLFGFKGWDGHTEDEVPVGWVANANEHEHCVTLGQAV